MANYVSMPDFDYGGYLAHHGILGQKWGIRRYQNDDGTLTPAGKKRYGKGIGEYGKKKQSLGRRLVAGDTILGDKGIADRMEGIAKNRIEKLKSQGKDASKWEKYHDAQKKSNVALDKYISDTSTKKLLAQDFILGRGADSYRRGRARGEGRAEAFLDSLASDLYFPAGAAVNLYKNKKKYGGYAY